MYLKQQNNKETLKISPELKTPLENKNHDLENYQKLKYSKEIKE